MQAKFYITMSWDLNQDQYDACLGALSEAGVIGVEEERVGSKTRLMATWLVGPDLFFYHALLKSLGPLPWPVGPIHSDPNSPLWRACQSVLPTANLLGLAVVMEENWAEKWKQGLEPFSVGASFYITPPWEKRHPKKRNIVVEPGQAFGTGYHVTTQLAISLLERAQLPKNDSHALDLGTGSGILSLAMAHLGWQNIVATELDPVCVEEFTHNFQLSFSERERSHQKVKLFTQSGFPTGNYDLILANITTDVLMGFPAFTSLAKSGTELILSGIYKEEWPEIEAHFATHFHLYEHKEQDNWHAGLWRYNSVP